MVSQLHQHEIRQGQRFRFGKNWSRFLRTLNDGRIAMARQSLTDMLELSDLSDRTFLDIGSGSGLFSLAARQLGATVQSFDYDPESVACTQMLKDSFFPVDAHWTVAEGSVLNAEEMAKRGQVDIVYSWGVLHHTGSMWNAIENAMRAVVPGGLLYLALYNDEGLRSRLWHWVKRTYNRLPVVMQGPVGLVAAIAWELRMLAVSLLTLRLPDYIHSWSRYQETSRRGMSRIHDIIDWIGGYPFEVAKPDDVIAFGRRHGFWLKRLVTTRGLGCNEYVFMRIEDRPG